VNGILLVDKPKGWTSFDAVNKVRRLIQHSDLNVTGKKRFPVGHTGTLDPQATGLLVLLLGTYTKQAPGLIKLDKTYEVTMRLGQTSSTGDEEGDKTSVSDRRPTEAEVRGALGQFVGDSLQTPPAYSAIKVNGQRAYKLARAGKPVKLEPRPVHIESFTLIKYGYPFVEFTAHVSSGTYIRSLVEDIGQKLQTGAYMSDLRRTQVGRYLIDKALPADAVTLEAIEKHVGKL
jgi:tRNA pseudouridine55 synthase